MKAPLLPTLQSTSLAALLALPLLVTLPAHAGGEGKNPAPVAPSGPATATEKDLAGDVGRYFGQRANLYRDNNRKLAKIDLDADLNYDGVIDNNDPADGGAFETTPPGLVVGKGELARIVLRITPLKIDYEGRAKVRLQVDGINRAVKTGEFAQGAEQSGMGHIIVWRDASKKEKILDSRDPNMRAHTWTLEQRSPVNMSVVPRTLYVEGISPSPGYKGDIRLLLTCFDENPALDNASDADPRKWIKSFRPTYDHILVTVEKAPHVKDYVNGNGDGVWISPKKELPIK